MALPWSRWAKAEGLCLLYLGQGGVKRWPHHWIVSHACRQFIQVHRLHLEQRYQKQRQKDQSCPVPGQMEAQRRLNSANLVHGEVEDRDVVIPRSSPCPASCQIPHREDLHLAHLKFRSCTVGGVPIALSQVYFLVKIVS